MQDDKEETTVDVASSTAVDDPEQLDWEHVRKLSLRSGGFREERVALWTKLLHVEHPQDTSAKDEPPVHLLDIDELSVPPMVETHPDERQVRLDTDRSFVLYPVGDMKDREGRQNELHDLIVELFRKRRKLSYFQGYHDIVSVLFLTLPKELQLPAVEKLSLHRLRDSMGANLEPVLGLLRVLGRIILDADPEYASILNQAGPLPYYALSNLLTLFSHDMPTLSLIQHVFDYLLCRPPILVVYLAAAVLLSRKVEVQRLQEEDEEGMIHSLLSSLPDLYDYDGDEEPVIPTQPEADAVTETSTPKSTVPEPTEEVVTSRDAPEKASPNLDDDVLYDAPSSEDESVTDVSSHPDDATLVGESSYHTSDTEMALPSILEDEPTLVSDPSEKTSHHLHEQSAETVGSFQTAPEVADPQESSEVEERAPAPVIEGVRRPRIHISTLLEHADELFARYPPMDPSINLPSIMGPQSVMLRWSENPALLPTDDETELIVTKPHLIVLPPPPEDDEDNEDVTEEVKSERGRRRTHRKLRKPTRIGSMLVEHKTVVASAVIVLGVAMAVTYGFQVTPERHHSHAAARELKRFGKYVGAFMVGMGGRLADGMVAMVHI